MRADGVSSTLSLSSITVAEQAPPDAMVIAAETGCQHISVRLMSGPPGGDGEPILGDPALLRETIRRSRETRVTVLDVEVARLGPDIAVEAFAPFLDTAASLGARRVLVTGDDPDEARLTDCFAAFCDAARSRGLSADLEFMPCLSVRDLATAARIARGADRTDAGILVDAVHLDRAGDTVDALATISPGLLHYRQICDATAERPADVDTMIHAARSERMLPGDGALPLVKLLARLAAGHHRGAGNPDSDMGAHRRCAPARHPLRRGDARGARPGTRRPRGLTTEGATLSVGQETFVTLVSRVLYTVSTGYAGNTSARRRQPRPLTRLRRRARRQHRNHERAGRAGRTMTGACGLSATPRNNAASGHAAANAARTRAAVSVMGAATSLTRGRNVPNSAVARGRGEVMASPNRAAAARKSRARLDVVRAMPDGGAR